MGTRPALISVGLLCSSVFHMMGFVGLHFAVGNLLLCLLLLLLIQKPVRAHSRFLAGILFGLLLFLHPLKIILPFALGVAAVFLGYKNRLRICFSWKFAAGALVGLLPGFGIGFVSVLRWIATGPSMVNPLLRLKYLVVCTRTLAEQFFAFDIYLQRLMPTGKASLVLWTFVAPGMIVLFLLLCVRSGQKTKNSPVTFLSVVLLVLLLSSALTFQPMGVFHQLADITIPILFILMGFLTFRVCERIASLLRVRTLAVLLPLALLLIGSSAWQTINFIQTTRNNTTLESFSKNEFKELSDYLEQNAIEPVMMNDALLGIVEYYTKGKVRPEHAGYAMSSAQENDDSLIATMDKLLMANSGREFLFVERGGKFMPRFEKYAYRLIEDGLFNFEPIQRFGTESSPTFTLCRIASHTNP